MSTNGDDCPYWDIDALLAWIGGGETGITDIEREAGYGRLTMTGRRYGPLEDGVLEGRKPIPATAFADHVISRQQGRWVLALDPKRWMPLEGWCDLMARSDDARQLWPHGGGNRPSPGAVPSNTPYSEYLCQRIGERIAARRSQEAVDAGVEWLSYPQAVQLVLPALFGADWVELATEQEKVVLSLGPVHRDWRHYSELHAEREAQIARAERWLSVKGLIEEKRGRRLVRAGALRDALAAEPTAQTTAPLEKGQTPRTAADTMPAAARRWLTEAYPNGIPPGVTNKMLANEYRRSRNDAPMSERTMRRARSNS